MISKKEIIAILTSHTKEMENYGYFGSNPGVSEDDYEEIADEILQKINEEAQGHSRSVTTVGTSI